MVCMIQSLKSKSLFSRQCYTIKIKYLYNSDSKDKFYGGFLEAKAECVEPEYKEIEDVSNSIPFEGSSVFRSVSNYFPV